MTDSEQPAHEPYEIDGGWHYRCDVVRMTWGPWPNEESVLTMIKAHCWSFPECRPSPCSASEGEHTLPHVDCKGL